MDDTKQTSHDGDANQSQKNQRIADPRDPDVRDAEDVDPHTGASDDPRVDPTPDRRQSEAEKR